MNHIDTILERLFSVQLAAKEKRTHGNKEHENPFMVYELEELRVFNELFRKGLSKQELTHTQASFLAYMGNQFRY